MTTRFMERGHAAVNARNPLEAAQWFEQEVRQNPRNAQARAWLGQALCSIGRRDEGVGYLSEAGFQMLEDAGAGKDLGKALEIAAQLQRWGEFASALPLLQRATQIDESGFRGFQMLAVTYAQLNRKSEAVEAGEHALSLSPDHQMMQVLQASLEADLGRYEAARTRLIDVLHTQPDARVGFRAHKEMARVADKLGVYDQVFPHLHAAGHLSASLPEYTQHDATLIPNMVRTNRTDFGRSTLGRRAAVVPSDDRPAPCFLMGFMRSGTTLTQEVLAAHPGVFVSDEVDFISDMKRELHRRDPSNASTAEKLAKLDDSGIIRLRDFYWARVKERFGDSIDGRVFVDKFTMSTIDLGFLNHVFPDAKVVFVMRDPRDVCLSCFLQLMVPTPTTVQLLSWEGTARFYALVMDWWLYVKREMAVDYIEFRYEDAVSAFEPTYRKVFEFLGLTWDPAVVDFHEHAAQKFIASPSRTQVAQPLYASSVGRWRLFEAEFAKVSASLDPFIDAFGYRGL